MKKHLIGFSLPLLICVLVPLGATAANLVMSHSPWSIASCESMAFTVPAQDDRSPVQGQTVTSSVSPKDGASSLDTNSTATGRNGQTATTWTLVSDASDSYTVTPWGGTKSTSGTATDETTPPPPPPSDYYPWVISHLGSGAPGDTLTLIVEVRGEDENPVPGQTVTFSILSGDGNAWLSTTSATTGNNGRAQTTLTLGNSASGSYNVKASISNHLFATSYTTVNTPPPPPPELSIRVVSGPGSGDPGDALTFTVEVQEDGSAASGKTVTFSITSGDGNASLNPTSATTGSNGRVQTTLTLGNSASGSYTVTAMVGSKSTSGTATVNIPPPPPPELSIRVVSGPGAGDPGDALTFTVEVQEDGSAASGKTVTFSITSGDGNASLGTTSTTTGSNGRAQTTLTLGNSASGSYTITATVGSKSTSGTATVNTPSPPLRSLVMSHSPWPIDPGESMTFTVTVKEGESAAPGKTVTFSVSPDDGTVSLNPTSTTTGSNGQAQTTLTTGSGSSGSYTVTASVGDSSVSGTATVETSPPLTGLAISVVSGPGSGEPGDTLTFIVEVQEDGSAASGKTVAFSITSGDANSSLGTTSATTGSNGRAQTTLTLGNSASGSYTITAMVGSKSTSGTATVETTPPPPPPSDYYPWVISQLGSGAPGDTLTLIVEVRGEDENPVPGQTVTFSILSGDGNAWLSTTSATTGSNGRAQTTLTLGNSASGSYNVKVTISNHLFATSVATVETSPSPELSISVVSGPGSGAPGDTLTFIVEVQEDGSAASGKTVTFSITSGDGNASLGTTSTTTGSNGRAQTMLTLGNSASGSYTVTASVDDSSVSGTATVETSPPPTGLAISVVSGPGSGAPGDALTFIVEVQEDGSSASGKTVTFNITSGDGNASLNPTSATTGSNGQASTTLTFGNSASGSYTITATIGTKSTSGTATVNTSPPPPPLRTLVMSHSPWPLDPGESMTFIVAVQEDGSAASGKTVIFSVSPDDGTVSLSATSATTDSNGQAQTILRTGSGSSGSYTVTASVGTSSLSSTVTVDTSTSEQQQQEDSSDDDSSDDDLPPPPMPTALAILLDDYQTGLPGKALANPFVVEVRNQNGDPLEGVTVGFAVTAGEGSLSTTTAMTDANGQAESTLTLGSEPGTNTVEVSVEGLTQTEVFSAEANLPPPVPTVLSIVSGDNQSGLTGETLANAFVVEVRNQYDAPLESAAVTFTVTSGGGSLSASTQMTDANGQAESTLTLGSEPGTNTVEVSVEGLTQTEVFSAEASLPPPVPTVLSIVSGENQEGVTGEALVNPFVVEVRDQYDNPMAGVTVSFAVSAGGGMLSSEMVMTDANGQAESTLTLGSDPGANSVKVSVEGSSQVVVFSSIAELLEFNLTLPSGISFIHVPLKVASVDGMAQTIESVGDLYDALGGAATVKLLITYNHDTHQWNSYLGDESRGDAEDRILTADLGIIASMKTPVSVRLGGEALGVDGMSSIRLNRGMNLVGLPLKDSRIMRVSDLLALEGIAGNVYTIVVSDERRFKTVGRADDDGDIHVTGGGAFLLIATEAVTVDISGEGWTNSPVMRAAPPIALAGVEVSDATPVLALTGSISVDGTGLNKAGVLVTVKNLTTGKSVTTAMLNRGYRDVDYQTTTVDMGTGQAGRIGDVLEVSAQSTAQSIRFHPVRYIVTSDDVERSRIHLPELIAYEIPAKTELLSNYPNPFNPETWIPYGLANDTDVQIAIYDISGALVRQLDLGHQRAGHYTQRSRAAYWDGRNGIGEDVASGVYFYSLTADDFTATRKMLIGK